MKMIIEFNHISPNLTSEEVKKLRHWYGYYHRLCTCYKWRHKRLKRIRLSLNMSSALLVIVGSIAGGVTANPIVLGCISGPGVLIQTYIAKSSVNKKIEMCKFAYVSYGSLLTQIRSFLRGMPYDESTFLSEAKVIDDIVCDLCPTIDGVSERYDRKYGSV